MCSDAQVRFAFSRNDFGGSTHMLPGKPVAMQCSLLRRIASKTLPVDGVFDSAANFLVGLAGVGDGQPDERGVVRLVGNEGDCP